MKLNRIFIAGFGGFLGSALRYIISAATVKYLGDFPLGTLIVNVAGGFAMGFIMEACGTGWSLSAEAKIFLTTGIMGGLTTFSAFSYETVEFFSAGRYFMGTVNAGLNLFAALLACWLGKAAACL
ncbi:MAG TPA: fluoride efflux transporter CrcB [Ruminococcaceae bacterium]|jgi:CrcB protein|nr:fluoride efflux transporter CrcB [Oscillospiraceae bacterium]